MDTGRLIAIESKSIYWNDKFNFKFSSYFILFLGVPPMIFALIYFLYNNIGLSYDEGFGILIPILGLITCSVLVYFGRETFKSRIRFRIYEKGFVPGHKYIDESGRKKPIFIKWIDVQEIKRVNMLGNRKKWVYYVNSHIISYDMFSLKSRKIVLDFMKKIANIYPTATP